MLQTIGLLLKDVIHSGSILRDAHCWLHRTVRQGAWDLWKGYQWNTTTKQKCCKRRITMNLITIWLCLGSAPYLVSKACSSLWGVKIIPRSEWLPLLSFLSIIHKADLCLHPSTAILVYLLLPLHYSKFILWQPRRIPCHEGISFPEFINRIPFTKLQSLKR